MHVHDVGSTPVGGITVADALSAILTTSHAGGPLPAPDAGEGKQD